MKFLLWTKPCYLSFRSAYDTYKNLQWKTEWQGRRGTAEMVGFFFKQVFAAKYSSWEQQQQKPHSFCLCDKYKLGMFFTFRELSQDKLLPLMSAAKSLSYFTFW